MASTVGISGVDEAVSYRLAGHGRKNFYANERFWVFYSDGLNMLCKTSVDGVSWSAAITIRDCVDGHDFAIFFDGTYFDYVYSEGIAGTAIRYRRGFPNADGTITWSTLSEQDVILESGVNYYAPAISIDSGGYPWISYQRFTPYRRQPYVITSSVNDGSWTTSGGFPYALSTGQCGWMADVIPLTSRSVLAIYACQYLAVKSQRWDGSWAPERTTTSNIYFEYFSAVNQGDDVHLCFLKDITYDIIYVKYTYATDSWGAEETVQSATTSGSCPFLSIDKTTNNLYCFWIGSPTDGHVYYKKHDTTGWDISPTDWIDERADGFSINSLGRSFYQNYDSNIGLVYVTATSSPYNVRFDFLTIGVPPKGTIAIHAKLAGMI